MRHSLKCLSQIRSTSTCPRPSSISSFPFSLSSSSYSTTPAFSTPSTPNHEVQVPHTSQLEELRPIFRTTTLNSQNGSCKMSPVSNRDWRDKFMATYNVRPVMNNKKAESFLYDWRYDWSCFWDESDVPLDPNKDYVFKNHLEMWECGFVHMPEQFDEFGDYINYNELCQDFSLMSELKQLTNNYDGSQWHPGGFPLFPIIIKFDKTKEFTPQAVLKTLSAHENLQQNEAIETQHITRQSNVVHARKTQEANQRIEEWFKKHFGESYIAFQAGAQLVNPVPWFCVGKSKTGNLIGLISALDIPQEHKVINWS